MLKKFLELGHEETKEFNLVIRPLIILCIAVAFTVIVGSLRGTISSETIDGYVNALVMVWLITLFNAGYEDIKSELKKYREDNFKGQRGE